MDAAQLIASRPEVSLEAKHSSDSGKHHDIKEGEDGKKGRRRMNKKKDEGNGKRRKKLSKMKHYWLGKAKEAKPDSEEDTGHTEPVVTSTEDTIEAAAPVRPEPSKQELIAAMESVVATLGDRAKFEESGVDSVLALMRVYSKDPLVQAEICRLVMDLAATARNRAKVREAGGILLVVLTMQTHMKEHNVQTWASGALRKLAIDPLNRQRIVDIGGIECILSAMLQHPDKANLQEQGCAALYNLSLGEETGRVEIQQNGGIPVVIRAMKNFRDHPGVTAMAAGALGNIAFDDQNKNWVRDYGGLELIIDALVHHTDDEVVERSCGALRILSRNSINALDIAREGGIPALLQVMETHRHHHLIQEYSAACLQNLAVDDFIRDRIVARGGVRRIVKAMYEHPTEAPLLAQCCASLMNFATTDTNRLVMLSEGAVEAVLFAMQIKENAAIQEHSCAMLANMALNGKCAMKISEEGIKPILSAMATHSANPSVQEKACGAILNLSEFDVVRRRLNRKHAAQAIMEAMENHPHHEGVRKYTSAALLRIMSDEGKTVPPTF